VYKLIRKSPLLDKDWGLKDQMQQSSISIPSNIAEGDARKSDKNSVRFFHIALGSLAELVTQIEIAV
jgi:four helix bundle protein